jgi:Contractile injection system tube protein
MALSRRPKVLKAGLILLDPETVEIKRIIALQYNPETLAHAYEIRGASDANRSEPLRLLGPPVETITVEAFLDATDQMEFPKENPEAAKRGVQAALSVLEMLIYPDSDQLLANLQRANEGRLEILPIEKYLTLFVWGKDRVVPVRVTQFSANEEDFTPDLYPLRARVSLTLRVLSVDDLGFEHRGGSLYLRYHMNKERFAKKVQSADLQVLGSISLE